LSLVLTEANRTLEWNQSLTQCLTGHHSLKQLKEGLFKCGSKGKRPISCKKYTGKEMKSAVYDVLPPHEYS
jgi:hypothetical protein